MFRQAMFLTCLCSILSTAARADDDKAKQRKLYDLVGQAQRQCPGNYGNSRDSVIADHKKQYEALKAQAVELNGGPDFAVGLQGQKPSEVFAKCEEKSAALFAAGDAQQKAQDKKTAELRQEWNKAGAKEHAEKAADRAKLKGDRVAVFDKHGYPDDSAHGEGWTKASTWTFGTTNEAIQARQLSPCLTIITFNGDKKTGEKRSGFSCRYL